MDIVCPYRLFHKKHVFSYSASKYPHILKRNWTRTSFKIKLVKIKKLKCLSLISEALLLDSFHVPSSIFIIVIPSSLLVVIYCFLCKRFVILINNNKKSLISYRKIKILHVWITIYKLCSWVQTWKYPIPRSVKPNFKIFARITFTFLNPY